MACLLDRAAIKMRKWTDNGEKEGKGVPRPHVEPIRPYKTSAPVTLQDSTDNQLTDVHTKKGN